MGDELRYRLKVHAKINVSVNGTATRENAPLDKIHFCNNLFRRANHFINFIR